MVWLLAWFAIGLQTAHAGPASGERPRHAFFGDLHMHTAFSLDAYLFGVRALPDDAYEFAKGRPLRHPNGQSLRIHRPLDFMAVTDHAEYLGSLERMADKGHPISRHPLAERVGSKDASVRRQAYIDFTSAGRAGRPVQGIAHPDVYEDAWARTVAAANRHYQPGKFTTFIGFEWSASPGGQNLHRNVIFRGDAAPLPFSRLNSLRPEHLWDWMDEARSKGHALLAIPHNPNLSDGLMFDLRDSFNQPLSVARAEQRLRNEPLVEVVQNKGSSETHPSLSPEDPFADFELVEQRVGMSAPVRQFAGGYARDALKRGLTFQDSLGINPFAFGMAGATDGHTGMVIDREDRYSGVIGDADGSPEMRLQKSWFEMDVRRFGAAGLTGIWAEENTRESIFAAMERREAWATSGPRIQLRFFGGSGLEGLALSDRRWVSRAYRRGVSMGGILPHADGAAPVFIVWARKDPDGANLDRIQIVKGWLKDGRAYERVFDVAWSGGRKRDPVTGRVPSVGTTVNVASASYRNTIGAAELSAAWRDPDFDASQQAFYYARVLEIPTPRWSTYDARALGIAPPADLPPAIQERAFSSPIWHVARSVRANGGR